MRVILLGPPGSGKGTQGALIEQKFGFPKISTGDLLRQAVQKKTRLGMQAEAAMDRGELVSDDIVLQMVADRVAKEDCKGGYVLDGFPRNMKQALMLEGLDHLHEVALDIGLSEQVLISRLSSRRICSRCGNIYNLIAKAPDKVGLCDICQGELMQRRDDEPDVIKERLRVYHQETEPLVQYYRRQDVYHRIDGDRRIERIFQDIQTILEGEIKKYKQKEAVL
jgi:adenylate kinase